jgi:hypothetical protein
MSAICSTALEHAAAARQQARGPVDVRNNQTTRFAFFKIKGLLAFSDTQCSVVHIYMTGSDEGDLSRDLYACRADSDYIVYYSPDTGVGSSLVARRGSRESSRERRSKFECQSCTFCPEVVCSCCSAAAGFVAQGGTALATHLACHRTTAKLSQPSVGRLWVWWRCLAQRTRRRVVAACAATSTRARSMRAVTTR